jgi:Heparinase II/III-like protein
MMNRRLLLALVLGVSTITAFAAGNDPGRMKNNHDLLANLRPGHPRLLATAADFAALSGRAGQDPLLAATLDRVRQQAELFLAVPVVEYKLVGPRLLDQSRAALNRILTCALAFRLTGDARFRDRAVKEMLTAAAFRDWNPSHFLDVAEMSTALALGYDWLYADLTAEERGAVKQALLDKALSFAPAAYAKGGPTDKRLWFATRVNNWNQVCNGGLLATALALADEEPALARTVIAGVCVSLPRAVTAYDPDGAYPEGPGYWDYGTTYNVLALAMLDSAVGTRFDLDRSPAFQRTAWYRLAVQGPTGLGFNYADGGAGMGAAPAFTWLAQRFGPPAALAHCRALLADDVKKKVNVRGGDRFFALHALWFPAVTKDPNDAPSDTPLDFHFRGPADIVLLRSAWGDPRALFVGFKAGDNSANHSHLDLGSFVLDADGVRWAADLGPDDYNLPTYFGAQRWTYFRLNNRSHNTLTPGHALQNAKAVAPIVAFGSAPNRAFAVADLTPAYPGAAKKMLRGVTLLDRARVLVQDDIAGLKSGTSLRWTMVTTAKIALSADGRTATLTEKGRTLRAEILAPANGPKFTVDSTRPPTSAENPNTGTALLAIDTIPSSADFCLAVLLTPVGNRWPANLPPPELTPLPAR